MPLTAKEYEEMSNKASPKSPMLKNIIKAFIVGGTICAVGQLLNEAYMNMGADVKTAGSLVSVTLIFVAALLTGLNVYDKIAKHAGAGTLVPITGFSNSVVAPALEFKAEGFVLGMAAKMFSIAGPVIVYGTVASVIYGIIYWITTLY